MKPRSRISLNALRTFEAVSRHQSMTEAAHELSVTPGAVSKQIAELQRALSFDLFDGPRHAMHASIDGQVLAATLTKALDDIDATLLQLDKNRDKILDVACLSTMAVRWLLPRIHRFKSLNPEIELRLSTDPRAPDKTVNRLDVSILALAPDEPPRPDDIHLFHETFGPVLQANQNHSPSLEEIESLPRLTTNTRPRAWDDWRNAAGFKGKTQQQTLAFDHLSLAIEGAANGLGVCVTPAHLVSADIARGRLIAPFGFLPSGYSYVLRSYGRRKRKAAIFVQWLIADMKTTPS